MLHGLKDKNTPFISNADKFYNYLLQNNDKNIIRIYPNFGHFLNKINPDFSETYNQLDQ
jgi:hypothetical protein